MSFTDVDVSALGVKRWTTVKHLNLITQRVIGAAMQVHRELGPGLLESTYERCLVYELQRQKIGIEQQVPVHIVYGDLVVERAYIMDLLVEGEVVVELKAVDKIMDVHKAQVLTHLKWAGLHVGLLVNFNVTMLKEGIRRLVRGYRD